MLRRNTPRRLAWRTVPLMAGSGAATGTATSLTTAAGYYRPDHRFSPAVNADRLGAATALAHRLRMTLRNDNDVIAPVA